MKKEEIESLKTNMELEIFVHGALYSGVIPPIGSADRLPGVSADRLGQPADAHGLGCECT